MLTVSFYFQAIFMHIYFVKLNIKYNKRDNAFYLDILDPFVQTPFRDLAVLFLKALTQGHRVSL